VEIELVFNGPLRTCDYAMLSKYLIRNQAQAAGLTATFMPKPLFGEPGNGMHVHHYLLRDGRPFLFERKRISQLARPGEYYVAGLLKHAPALCALTNPSTNSYKRLIAGYEAPIYTDYAVGSRASAIRIPEYVRDPKTQRIEYRIGDAMANPYLALPAMVMAGLDGLDRRLTGVSKKRLPGNLLEALNELKQDHEFLLRGGIFTEELLMQWIEVKTAEFEAVASRPTSQEYLLYFGG
jgi:glutamine synthetase